MEFTVLYRREIVGKTSLEHLDEGMNVRWGKFIPSTQYATIKNQLVYSSGNSELQILDSKGSSVVGTVSIRDFSEGTEQGECEIEVLPI
jgi:hypothetical protein